MRGQGRATGEEGFTLVELLMAISIGTMVMLATFQSLDLFSATANHQSRVADASDQARTLMEQTVRDLRGAGEVTYAGSQDLIYAVPVTAGKRWTRLCISGGYLYSHTATSPAAALTTGTSCSSGTLVGTVKAASNTGFTYDGSPTSTTPATVKNVGVTIEFDAGTTKEPAKSRLTASASRRVGTLQLTDGDLDATCTSTGAQLKLDTGLAGLKVEYSGDGGISLGTQAAAPGAQLTGFVTIPKTVTNVVARVTDAAGLTRTISQSVDCA